MPKFRVLCRVDAFVDYETEVDAQTAESASLIASRSPDRLTWRPAGNHEHDARLFVTLDDAGREIDGSQVGDFS